ncbi:hypothetical protein [Chthonobacter rhizosphaerae]|uniref:hypothetical protein n=1 Tax=Chthonobacter rhizosphaerae TaxID=2735553 RepID=UPI0015EFB668|nr:hypothetical protein [Chthonobacter rhizosphaerae]
MPFDYIDFVKAAKREEILAVTGFGAGEVVGFARWRGIEDVGLLWGTRKELWAQPSYEFGYFFDRSHNDWLGHEPYWSLRRDGISRLSQQTFSLPHPRCVYLFNCAEDEFDYERTYCVVLDQNSESIEGRIFVRQNASLNNLASNWIMDAATFHLKGSELHLHIHLARSRVSRSVAEMLEARTELVAEDVIVATTLLFQPRDVVQRSQTHLKKTREYNSLHGRASELPKPTKIEIGRSWLAGIRTGAATGSKKAGHERRAHTRVLWRGMPWQKKLDIPATKVNGGSATQSYLVRFT